MEQLIVQPISCPHRTISYYHPHCQEHYCYVLDNTHIFWQHGYHTGDVEGLI